MPLYLALYLYLAALALMPLAAHAQPRLGAKALPHTESRQATASAPTAPTAPRRANARHRKPRIVYLPSPSEESSLQRDRRLQRECRGLPNAGACLGYAHPGLER